MKGQKPNTLPICSGIFDNDIGKPAKKDSSIIQPSGFRAQSRCGTEQSGSILEKQLPGSNEHAEKEQGIEHKAKQAQENIRDGV